jgi:hypothetical protein
MGALTFRLVKYRILFQNEYVKFYNIIYNIIHHDSHTIFLLKNRHLYIVHIHMSVCVCAHVCVYTCDDS